MGTGAHGERIGQVDRVLSPYTRVDTSGIDERETVPEGVKGAGSGWGICRRATCLGSGTAGNGSAVVLTEILTNNNNTVGTELECLLVLYLELNPEQLAAVTEKLTENRGIAERIPED